MLYIKKEKPSVAVDQELHRVKRDTDWSQRDKTDTALARSAFDLLDKAIIRKQLIKEQRGLCAYCMRRIHDDENTTIEHWLPIHEDTEGTLNYSNLMACCDGGKSLMGNVQRILCCDAAKKDQKITICPYNKHQMEKISYRRDGRIWVPPEEKELYKDVNEVLHLNGVVNRSGKHIADTSTAIVHNRQQVYRKYIESMNSLLAGWRKTISRFEARLPENLIRSKMRKNMLNMPEYGFTFCDGSLKL